MGFDFPLAVLGDLVDDIIDRRGVTPLKLGSDFTSSGHRVISAKVIKGGRVDLSADSPRYVDSTTYAKWMKSPLLADDVLLTSEAPLGEVAWLDRNREWVLGQRLFGIRPDKRRLAGRYLYYAFQYPVVISDLHGRATGTTVLGIRQTQLRKVAIPLPPLDEQRRIAAVLGALDDKIELNRKMNRTLEAMAQALFKSWFIDFDGVPDSDLVESELGPIPKGCGVELVETMAAELETGNRPKGGVGDFKSGVPSIGAESIDGIGEFDFSKTKYVPEEYFKALRQGVLKSRDILLYKDGGKPGDFRPHVGLFGDGFPFARCAINSHVYRLRLREPLSQEYGYFWFSSERVMAEMRRLGTGVAIPSLPRRNLLNMRMLIPDAAVVAAFDEFAVPLVGRILRNAREAQILATLRDTLLPKLISGEVRVPEAETAVEAVL